MTDTPRKATVERKTRETEIRLELSLDGGADRVHGCSPSTPSPDGPPGGPPGAPPS